MNRKTKEIPKPATSKEELTACCESVLLERCCPAEAKSSCCGAQASAPASCGCR